jgi:hypothetical protein
MAVNKVGGFVSMGKEREEERRAAGTLTTCEDGRWCLKTDTIERTYEVLGFDEGSQTTRLLVVEETRT